MSLDETFQKKLVIEICTVISGKLTPISGYWPWSYLLLLQKAQEAVKRQVWTPSDSAKGNVTFLQIRRIKWQKDLVGLLLKTFVSNFSIKKNQNQSKTIQSASVIIHCISFLITPSWKQCLGLRFFFLLVVIYAYKEGLAACIPVLLQQQDGVAWAPRNSYPWKECRVRKVYEKEQHKKLYFLTRSCIKLCFIQVTPQGLCVSPR